MKIDMVKVNILTVPYQMQSIRSYLPSSLISSTIKDDKYFLFRHASLCKQTRDERFSLRGEFSTLAVKDYLNLILFSDKS